MQKIYLYILLPFFIQLSFAQNEKLISGKIICENSFVSNIQVTNLVSEKSTVSDTNGDFSIFAKAEDMLVFTSINYDYKRKILEQEDIDSNYFTVILTKKIERLDEVIVTKFKSLDAVSLRILEKPAKEYTPAERRLKTATSLDATANAGMMMGGAMSLDPFLNWLSGRTKKLKNQLEIERNEILLLKIKALYKDDYYIKKLRINQDLINAFQYYAIYDSQFVADLKSNNKTKINFRIIELAQKFNNLQINEK